MRARVTAAAVASALVLTLAACDGGSDSLGSGSDYSVQGALTQLPPVEADAPVMVQTGDLVAATEQAGLERPEELDGDALAAWIGALTGIPGDDGPVPVFVPVASLLNIQRIRDHQEFADELGWSVLDVDAFVEQSSPPETFTVVTGDIDDSSLSPDLPEIADGVVTAGEGEDFHSDLGDITVARPVGIPLRLAQQEQTIAAAPSTEAVAGWVDGLEETLADHAGLSAVARALDGGGAISAVLVTGSSMALTDAVGGRLSPEQIEQLTSQVSPLLPTDPFDTVGIGWAASDGTSVITAAYHFASEEAAEAAVPIFENMFAEATTISDGRPLSTLLTLERAEHDGPVAVLTISPAADQPVATVLTMLSRGDLPFVHH